MWRLLRNRRLILHLYYFQGTHILGASRGGPCVSVASCCILNNVLLFEFFVEQTNVDDDRMTERWTWANSSTKTTQRSNRSMSASLTNLSRNLKTWHSMLRLRRCKTSSTMSVVCWEFPAIPGNSRQHSLVDNLAETSRRRQELISCIPSSPSHQRPPLPPPPYYILAYTDANVAP